MAAVGNPDTEKMHPVLGACPRQRCGDERAADDRSGSRDATRNAFGILDRQDAIACWFAIQSISTQCTVLPISGARYEVRWKSRLTRFFERKIHELPHPSLPAG